jgi:hypothetical protein
MVAVSLQVGGTPVASVELEEYRMLTLGSADGLEPVYEAWPVRLRGARGATR